MKTLKDFKGTQGEFVIFGVDQTMVTALPHQIIVDGSNYNLSWEEAKANAKLFANSKKVLEAAIWAHRELETAMGLTEWDPKIEKIMRENLAKLKEAINNSL